MADQMSVCGTDWQGGAYPRGRRTVALDLCERFVARKGGRAVFRDATAQSENAP